MSLRQGLWTLLAALVAGDIYFAATLPATSAEAVVYTRYTSKPLLEMWSAPFEPRIGIPYLLLDRIAKWVGGVSELTLRFPAIFAGLLWGLSLIRVPLGWRTALLIAMFLLSDPSRVFSTASGTGLGLGLTALALLYLDTNLRLAGVLLGLAVASAPTWIVGTASLGMAAVIILKKRGWVALDEFLIPALLSAVLFLSPSMLARGVPIAAQADDLETRELVRKIPVGRSVSVGVSRAIEPGAAFYKRRLHLNWKNLASLVSPGATFDYYLLLPEDRGLARKEGLKIEASAGKEILAGR